MAPVLFLTANAGSVVVKVTLAIVTTVTAIGVIAAVVSVGVLVAKSQSKPALADLPELLVSKSVIYVNRKVYFSERDIFFNATEALFTMVQALNESLQNAFPSTFYGQKVLEFSGKPEIINSTICRINGSLDDQIQGDAVARLLRRRLASTKTVTNLLTTNSFRTQTCRMASILAEKRVKKSAPLPKRRFLFKQFFQPYRLRTIPLMKQRESCDVIVSNYLQLSIIRLEVNLYFRASNSENVTSIKIKELLRNDYAPPVSLLNACGGPSEAIAEFNEELSTITDLQIVKETAPLPSQGIPPSLIEEVQEITVPPEFTTSISVSPEGSSTSTPSESETTPTQPTIASTEGTSSTNVPTIDSPETIGTTNPTSSSAATPSASASGVTMTPTENSTAISSINTSGTSPTTSIIVNSTSSNTDPTEPPTDPPETSIIIPTDEPDTTNSSISSIVTTSVTTSSTSTTEIPTDRTSTSPEPATTIIIG